MDANRHSSTTTGLSLQEILERTADNADITDWAGGREQESSSYLLNIRPIRDICGYPI